MTNAQHTPGPWKPAMQHSQQLVTIPDKTHGWRCLVVETSNGDIIARAYGATPEIAEANARLIAAAPELLDALENLANAICKNTNGMPDWLSRALDDANEAMRKARGQS